MPIEELQEYQVTSQRIAEDKYVDSRDFRIGSIAIVDSQGNATDITGLVQEVQVRQDLYLGFINGELLVTDAIDFYARTAFHGAEYIFLHLIEPQQKVLIKKAFRIYKISNRKTILNNAQQYFVYFVSDELVQSNTKKISKAYKASKISDIAIDIMINHLKISSDKIKVDETSEVVDVIIPNYRPTEAIQWLTTRAFNVNQTCYFFYENLDGFNFRSLQNLYQEADINKQAFVLQRKTVDKKLFSDKFSIDSFEFKHDFDVLNSVASGGYAMKLLGLDPFNQTFIANEYGLDDLPTLYPNPAMSNPKNDVGTLLFDSSDAHFLTYLQTEKTSTDQKNHSESWIKRVMALAALNSNLLEIVVPGNINAQVGKMVSLIFPYSITPSESDMVDKRKSGRYLIVAVNHKFDMINHLFQSLIMVARDSIPEALPAIDENIAMNIAKMTA
jgi:hypothetical protein